MLLTEAKNTDMEGGQCQNFVQQEACRESLANAYVFPPTMVGISRKRKYDDVFNVVRAIPTFGIVTTASQWRFTKVDHSKAKTVLTKSSTFGLFLDPKSECEKEAALGQIEVILRHIVGILEFQMQKVNDNTAVKDLMDTLDAKYVNDIEGVYEQEAFNAEGSEGDDKPTE